MPGLEYSMHGDLHVFSRPGSPCMGDCRVGVDSNVCIRAVLAPVFFTIYTMILYVPCLKIYLK